MQRRRIKTLLERADGSVAGVDRAKMAEIPFFFVTNPPNEAIVIPAGQSSALEIVSVSGEGPAEIDALSTERTGAALVKIRIMDGNTPRSLMNRDVHIDTIFGNGSLPFVMPESLYIDENRAANIIFSNISGAPNTIRPALSASRYLKEIYDPHLKITRNRLNRRQYLSCPYFYTFDTPVTALGIGAATTAQISIGTDHHFELWKITGVQTGPYDLNITDMTTGEPLVDGFQGNTFGISNGLIVGTAGFPFILKEPRRFKKGTKLMVNIQNRHGAPNTIFLTLSGRMIADRMWRFPDDPVDGSDVSE